MGEAQLIELKEHAPGDQQNAPEAMLAPHDVGNARANQKQRPESPQPVDGDIPHVVEEEGDSAEDEKGAPKETAAASADNVNAPHDGVAALSVRVHLLVHLRMNIAMNLVVESIAEFLGIEIIFVAHKLLLCILGPMVRLVTHRRPSQWKSQSQACKPGTAPGGHHAREAPQPESGSAARMIPRIAGRPTKTRRDRTRRLAGHGAPPELAQAASPEGVLPECRRLPQSASQRHPGLRRASGNPMQGAVLRQSASGSVGLFAVPPCWPSRGPVSGPTARIGTRPKGRTYDSAGRGVLPANSGCWEGNSGPSRLQPEPIRNHHDAVVMDLAGKVSPRVCPRETRLTSPSEFRLFRNCTTKPPSGV